MGRPGLQVTEKAGDISAAGDPEAERHSFPGVSPGRARFWPLKSMGLCVLWAGWYR